MHLAQQSGVRVDIVPGKQQDFAQVFENIPASTLQDDCYITFGGFQLLLIGADVC
jgi:hypothetical protein